MNRMSYYEANTALNRIIPCKDRRTCTTVRQGKVVQSWTDYILGFDRWTFLEHGCPGHKAQL